MKLPLTKLLIYRTLLEKKEPITGYDMTKTIPYQHQGVYRILGQALKKGLIEMTIEPQEGKPDRKYYTLVKRKCVKQEMVEALLANQVSASITPFDVDVVINCEKHVGKQTVLVWLNMVLKGYESMIHNKNDEIYPFTESMIERLKKELENRVGLSTMQNSADIALQ